jgi:hypothetical protein
VSISKKNERVKGYRDGGSDPKGLLASFLKQAIVLPSITPKALDVKAQGNALGRPENITCNAFGVEEHDHP